MNKTEEARTTAPFKLRNVAWLIAVLVIGVGLFALMFEPPHPYARRGQVWRARVKVKVESVTQDGTVRITRDAYDNAFVSLNQPPPDRHHIQELYDKLISRDIKPLRVSEIHFDGREVKVQGHEWIVIDGLEIRCLVVDLGESPRIARYWLAVDSADRVIFPQTVRIRSGSRTSFEIEGIAGRRPDQEPKIQGESRVSLARMQQDADPAVRAAAARLLCDSHKERSFDPLAVSALVDSDPFVRELGLQASLDRGLEHPSMLPELFRFADGPDQDFADRVAAQLAKMRARDEAGVLSTRLRRLLDAKSKSRRRRLPLELVEAVLVCGGDEAEALLIESARVSGEAFRVLARSDSALAKRCQVEVLLQSIARAERSRIDPAALKRLGDLQLYPERSVPLLTSVLQHEEISDFARVAGVGALAKFGASARAAADTIAMLPLESTRVQRAVTEALGVFGESSPHILRALAQCSRSKDARVARRARAVYHKLARVRQARAETPEAPAKPSRPLRGQICVVCQLQIDPVRGITFAAKGPMHAACSAKQ